MYSAPQLTRSPCSNQCLSAVSFRSRSKSDDNSFFQKLSPFYASPIWKVQQSVSCLPSISYLQLPPSPIRECKPPFLLSSHLIIVSDPQVNWQKGGRFCGRMWNLKCRTKLQTKSENTSRVWEGGQLDTGQMMKVVVEIWERREQESDVQLNQVSLALAVQTVQRNGMLLEIRCNEILRKYFSVGENVRWRTHESKGCLSWEGRRIRGSRVEQEWPSQGRQTPCQVPQLTKVCWETWLAYT